MLIFGIFNDFLLASWNKLIFKNIKYNVNNSWNLILSQNTIFLNDIAAKFLIILTVKIKLNKLF